jgi:hypothetical protein
MLVLACGGVPRQHVCLLGALCAAWGPPEMVAVLQGAACDVGRGGTVRTGDTLRDQCGPKGHGPSRMTLRSDGSLCGVQTGQGPPWGLPRVDAHAMGHVPVSVRLWDDLVRRCATQVVVAA